MNNNTFDSERLPPFEEKLNDLFCLGNPKTLMHKVFYDKFGLFSSKCVKFYAFPNETCYL